MMPSKNNPYFSNVVGHATIGVGVESANTILLSIQLQDAMFRNIGERQIVTMWLSTDANGDNPITDAIHMPNGGFAIGTDGTMFPGGGQVNGLLVAGGLVIDAVPEKFKTTATLTGRINGQHFTKAAQTAIVFSAAHVVSASKFGVILIQSDATGTVSSKVPLTTQAYTTAAAAFAALPMPDAGKVAVGYIAIAAGVAAWTANTDDMTNGSDVTTATFVDAPITLTSKNIPALFNVLSEPNGKVDILLSETRVKTFYAHVLPAGASKVSSGAIAFA